jgi:acyl carrier protein
MSQDEILAGIKEVLGTVASIDPSGVTPETTLADLGLDSLSTLEAVVAAEDRFGLLIPDDESARFKTVGDIVRYIEQATALVP